jgi:hypothetical protein
VSAARGVCTGCDREHDIAISGLIRDHRCGFSRCPGAFRDPVSGPVRDTQARGIQRAADAPTEPTYGRSCDGGDCEAPALGWRRYREPPEWLPVCGRHMDGPPGRTRLYDREMTR